ncbi:MAG: glycosyltransferase [Pseudomonadota bacterium]
MNREPVQRVLHIAPTPFFADRGCHLRIRGLVKALDARGLANRVCTYALGRDVPEVDTVRGFPIPGYRKTSAGPSPFKIVADFFLLLTAVRQIRAFRPDVLHCHLHEGVLVGWLAKYFALRPGLTLGFDVQGGLVSELKSYGHLKGGLLRRAVRWLEAFTIARADVYFCSSQASVDLFKAEYGVEPARLRLVPDGTDVALPDTPPPPAPRPVALYTGGLAESKGLGLLHAAMLEASRRELAVDFLIVGYPTDATERFVAEHALGNCTLAGRVPFEELGRYLQRATVCLEPKSGATSEASGKLLNYMAAALPVVCFDTPNSRAMLGDAGYFAAPDTAAAFVDQLEAALADPEQAAARGRAAGALAAERYSWAASAATIAATYGDPAT